VIKEILVRKVRVLGVCSLIVSAVALTSACASQGKSNEAKAKPDAAPSEAEMMEKWMAFMTPGAGHKVLDPLVGKWKTHMKMWMDPAAPVQESDGTSEFQWIMGGRYLEEHDNSTFMGQPFEGRCTWGFDNMKKKYVGTWIDNMGTGIMQSEGSYDASKKAFNYAAMGPDPTMSKYVPMRIVMTLVDANTTKMEMFGPDKSGKEYRGMEITYTRAK
jgi:hypothetical protein